MKNYKQTSGQIAELAGRTLGDSRASKRSKSLAGSALAQVTAVKAVPKRRAATSKRNQ